MLCPNCQQNAEIKIVSSIENEINLEITNIHTGYCSSCNFKWLPKVQEDKMRYAIDEAMEIRKETKSPYEKLILDAQEVKIPERVKRMLDHLDKLKEAIEKMPPEDLTAIYDKVVSAGEHKPYAKLERWLLNEPDYIVIENGNTDEKGKRKERQSE